MRRMSASLSSVENGPDVYRVWISIGSNQRRERSIRGAIAELRGRYGEPRLSSVYETDAVGFNGEPFLNLVAGFSTRSSVAELNRDLKAIEDAFGRVRGPDKFAPRTLDLDLLTYGDAVGVINGYRLPRGEILEYAFVLGPLAEVAPDELHPVVGRSYRDLWATFDQASQPMRIVPFRFDILRAGSISSEA